MGRFDVSHSYQVSFSAPAVLCNNVQIYTIPNDNYEDDHLGCPNTGSSQPRQHQDCVQGLEKVWTGMNSAPPTYRYQRLSKIKHQGDFNAGGKGTKKRFQDFVQNNGTHPTTQGFRTTKIRFEYSFIFFMNNQSKKCVNKRIKKQEKVLTKVKGRALR